MKAARLVIALLTLMSAGCGDRGTAGPSGSGGAEPSLKGRAFLSSTVTENGAPKQLAAKTRVRLQFTDDGRLIADGGCNSMQGQVSLRGGRIEVRDLQSTGMGCAKELHEQDSWLGSFLGGKPEWRLDGDKLVVRSDSTELVLVDRKVAEPDLPLQGTRWTVDTLVDGDVASSTPAGVTAMLVFDKEAVRTSAGCNQGSANYRLSGNTIHFDPIALTRKACPPEPTNVETAVLAVLNGEVTYQITADRLILKQANGKALELRGERG